MITGSIIHNGLTVLPFQVEPREASFQGQIISGIHSQFVELFADYESSVNDQLFSHVDHLDTQIEAMGFHALFSDGSIASIYDLQVFPNTGKLSFTVRGE